MEKGYFGIGLLILGGLFFSSAYGVQIGFDPSKTTATFEQAGGRTAASSIDGFGPGWAIGQGKSPPTDPESAFFVTSLPVVIPMGTTAEITFTMDHQSEAAGPLKLGKFRLSYTEDDPVIGVASSWIVLVPSSAVSSASTSMTINFDNSINVAVNPSIPDVYTVKTNIPTDLIITGFRLEALEDGSLPSAGPGLADNGNFELSVFSVDLKLIHGSGMKVGGELIPVDRVALLLYYTESNVFWIIPVIVSILLTGILISKKMKFAF